MSHYACPVCTGPTSVVETRRSKKGLRRRRRCDANHRFTTVELPHDTSKRAVGLIKWLTDKLDPDIADYALEEMRAIVAGIPEEPDDDQETTPDTTGLDAPVHSPFAPDAGHRHEIGPVADISWGEKAIDLGGSTDPHSSRTTADPHQVSAQGTPRASD